MHIQVHLALSKKKMKEKLFLKKIKEKLFDEKLIIKQGLYFQ